jgi:hypothetical protein
MTNAKGVLEWMEWEKKRKANMTNEEWLEQASTEEKAKWIAEEKMNRGYFIFPSMEEAIQDALVWLKEKHEE